MEELWRKQGQWSWREETEKFSEGKTLFTASPLDVGYGHFVWYQTREARGRAGKRTVKCRTGALHLRNACTWPWMAPGRLGGVA
jgi:hypothetical protein